MSKHDKKMKILLYIFYIVIFFIFLLLFLLNQLSPAFNDQKIKPSFNSLTEVSTELTTNNTSQNNNKRFYTSSFSDIFSSRTWLNDQQTDLFWDYSMTALTFEPKYKLQPIGDCRDKRWQCQDVDDFILPEKACSINGCLEITKDRLNYNGQELALPEEGTVVNLAIALFNDRWLVAGVRKGSEQDYQPIAWWFDGHNFQLVELPSNKNKSNLTKYFGRVAIGVSKDSALILYSSYEGRAWQINDKEIRDLSHLFGIRINNGGFWPKIISFGSGKLTNWYVFDQSGSDSVFLKFWQNGTAWIEGGVSLVGYLPKDSRAIYLAPTQNKNELVVKVVNGAKQSKLWSFLDLGFKNQPVYQATSINLTNHDQKKKEVVGAVISSLDGGLSGFSGQLLLSANGVDWLPVNLGQELYFASSSDKIFWRYQIEASNDSFASPFLKMITLSSFVL